MSHRIKCPVCLSEFSRPQGLNGHLRFSHGLSGDELDEVYERAKTEDQFSVEEDEMKGEKEESGTTHTAPVGDTAPVGGTVVTSRQVKAEDVPQREKEEKQIASAFDWSSRVDRIEELRGRLRAQGRSVQFFGLELRRDEGCEEAIEALDEIEMAVRERIGSGEEDRDFLREVDDSLDAMKRLLQARQQREEIKERFTGEKAQQRIDKLDGIEAEIRADIRSQWEVGTPVKELHRNDPVREYESGPIN